MTTNLPTTSLVVENNALVITRLDSTFLHINQSLVHPREPQLPPFSSPDITSTTPAPNPKYTKNRNPTTHNPIPNPNPHPQPTAFSNPHPYLLTLERPPNSTQRHYVDAKARHCLPYTIASIYTRRRRQDPDLPQKPHASPHIDRTNPLPSTSVTYAHKPCTTIAIPPTNPDPDPDPDPEAGEEGAVELRVEIDAQIYSLA
ncbi:hypothetical protein CC78DRAFT_583123 [Lojkania enalia]|uniref:Uncharacterized protein n=1 Tax=Lojkania enalia TaxID=147567 RepID=A0A9P4N7G9_9PLEO|nr:hypothetical protein CC78DRAFT_583123 [Didymosphaeria enalia]